MLSSLPTVSNLPAPAPSANGAPAPGSGEASEAPEGGSFAQALEQAGSPASPAGAARARSAAGKGAAAAPRGRAEAGPATDPARAAAQGPDHTDTTDLEAPADREEPATPATVAELLADLQARSPAAAATSTSAPAAPARSGDTAEAGTPKAKAPTEFTEALRGATQPRHADTPSAPADRRGLPQPAPGGSVVATGAAAADRLALAADPSVLARAETGSAGPTPGVPTTGSAPPAGFATTLAATVAAAAPATAAPAEATLTAHPSSAAFGPQLGATLSTFVRQGIEHARLQLNPAEMGPVQVQIQLDGANAQILLGADNALTRQALEQSLPLLAGTLREAGLTLAGGGVFEQARQGGGEPGGERGDAGPAGRRDTLGEPAEAPARTPLRSRGVVDLVA